MLWRKYPYVEQVDERDCGVAALSMILENFGSHYSLAHLRELAKTDMEGTTALGIVSAAESLGLSAKSIKTTVDLLDVVDIPFPFIVHVIKNKQTFHYYVIYKISKKYVYIGDPDPDVGRTKVRREKFLEEWSGVAFFFSEKVDFKKHKEPKGSLWDYLPILAKQKKLILNIILASLVLTMISIAGSYYFQGIIDNFIPNLATSLLGTISVGLIFAYVFEQVLSYGQNLLLSILGQRLSINIVLSYIRHIYELPLSFFSTRRTGEIVSRFTDANTIIDALASTILSAFLDIWVVFVLGMVLFLQDSTLFLITLCAIPMYVAVIMIFVKLFEQYNQETMQSNAILNSSIIEDINGIETIKSLNAEEQTYDRVDREFVDLLKKSFSYNRLTFFQEGLKQTIQLVLNVIVLWVGSYFVIKGRLSLGQLITYNAMLSYFTNPIQSIIDLQPKLQSAKVANNRLNEVYMVKSEFHKKRLIQSLSNEPMSIDLDHVSFGYGMSNATIKNVSVTFKAREKVALVGMSGSGKTTLAKLISGFYNLDLGKMTIGSTDAEYIDRHVLREYINYLPQEPYIFNGTIRKNLLLGVKGDISMKKIEDACRIAEIYDDIQSTPEGFETELSENGVELSGGQKQRITLARALLTEPKILILDEATSSLDALTEKRVIKNLMALENKTIIFVAHRLSIAQLTNNIIVMNKGNVVEIGTHANLLEKKGYYYDLVKA